MRPISDVRLEIIKILSDNNGHTHSDIKRQLSSNDKEYDGGNLSKKLGEMESNLICLGGPDNRYYYIIPTGETFSIIIDQSIEKSAMEFLKQFIASEYINGLMETLGFKSVVSAISSHLNNRAFRDIAVPALLCHSAATEEYENLPKLVEEQFNSMENASAIDAIRNKLRHDKAVRDEASVEKVQQGIFQPPFSSGFDRMKIAAIYKALTYDGAIYDNKIGKIEQLETLRGLGIEGVHFYRMILLEDFINLFTKRMTDSKGKSITKYAELDNYLSPFTAYPISHPMELIFSSSFKRLYEDVYLVDSKDIALLLERANLVFENFLEFSSSYIQSRANIETAIKELIFKWNTACARFEAIYYLLGELGYDPEISCFHLVNEETGFQIIDMKTEQPLLGESDIKRLEAGDLNSGFHEFDQTQFMRPVLIENLGSEWRKELAPIQDIISRIENNLGAQDL
jgi:hypothetical protein